LAEQCLTLRAFGRFCYRKEKAMSIGLFEVEVRNRVVKGSKFTRIKGTQGGWYYEPHPLCYLAESEAEAERFARAELGKRYILGIPKHTKRKIQRQVEILNIRRLA
jgi:hypothetical protein